MTIPIINKEPNTGRFQDENNTPRNIIERVTGAVNSISSDHAAIHSKWGYAMSGIFVSVANGATVNLAFKTPTVASNKYVHLKREEFWASGNKVRTDLYEAPTNAPTNGTAQPVVNRNRVGTVPDTAMQDVKSGMTLDLTGAINLETFQFGLGTVARPMDIELVLKPDTWYIRTFTNSTGGAVDISFFSFWYEEPAA